MKREMRWGSRAHAAGVVVIVLGACAGEPAEDLDGALESGTVTVEAPASTRELGPADGRDLPGTDLDRVAVDDVAPDFTLETYRGETLTLSENRGQREILLVFYRGAW